ncbi:MAG TPA: hypothetical protein DCP63_08375 [Bacteroidetes bacterium]|nr:hypothetical protein [Bacteroidota bacterium]
MRATLVLRLFLWSLLIFIASVLALNFRLLHSLELKTINIGATNRYRWGGTFMKLQEKPIVPLHLWAQSLPETYLKHCLQIVDRLKKAGAKVVMVPLTEKGGVTAKVQALLEQLQKTGIVVFADQEKTPNNYFDATDSRLDDPKNWWAQHPAFRRIPITWGVSTIRSAPMGVLLRFVPYRFRDFHIGDTLPDVSLQVLKKYWGYSDSLSIPQTSYTVLFGDRQIPVAGDGYVYLKYNFTPDYRRGVSAYADIGSDSLSFQSWTRDSVNHPDSAWAYYKDKMVVIDWGDLSPFWSYQQSFGWRYAQIIAAIMEQNYVTRSNEWDLLLILFLIIFLAALSYRFRGTFVLALSVVLFVATIWLSIWLFDNENTLFDPTYVLMPIILCGLILPVVRLTEERRLAEETIKSLKEENKRLRGGPQE